MENSLKERESSVDLPKELFAKIRHIHLATKREVHSLLAGAYHSAFKGRGMEFEEAREYQPGDEVRNIDWNVSARMSTPYVKNFREERELTVTLVVDLSASMHFGTVDKEKREWIAEIASLLAFSALQNNDRVGLLLFSDRIKQYLPPRRGTKSGLRLIRELLIDRKSTEKTDLSIPLSFLAKTKRKGGVVFFLSDLIASCPTQLLQMVSHLYDLTLLSITDPRESAFPNVGLTYVRDMEEEEEGCFIDSSLPDVQKAWAAAHRERIDSFRREVERAGGGFIEVRTDQSYLYPLSCYFYRKQLKS